MILCKRKRDSKRRTVQSTYIENSPSIRMGANSRKFTSFHTSNFQFYCTTFLHVRQEKNIDKGKRR